MSEAENNEPAFYEMALSFDNEDGERVFSLLVPLDPHEFDADIEYLFNRYPGGGMFELSIRPACIDQGEARRRIFPPGPHLSVEGTGGYYYISIGTWFGHSSSPWGPRPIKPAALAARGAEYPGAPFEPFTSDLAFVKRVCKEFARTKRLPSGFVV